MIFVAETAQNEIVGFADFGKGRDEFSEYDGELYAIYLLPEFQRKEIGGKLFKKCAEALKLRNYNSFYLEALEVSPYRNFYEKSGGKIIGRSEDKLGDEDFAIIRYGWDDLNKL